MRVRYLNIFLFIFLMTGLSTKSFAQVQAANSDFTKLTLEVSAPQEEYLKMEPIPVIFKVSNKTEKQILGHWSTIFSNSYIEMSIIHNGTVKQIKPRNIPQVRSLAGTSFALPTIIKPGEIHRMKQLLNFGLDELFPEAGAYQISFTLYNTPPNYQEKIFSNTLNINVVEPTGRNLEALKFIKEHGPFYNYFDVGMMNLHKDSQNNVREFVSNYGDTSYAPYAALGLGELYFSIGSNPGQMDPQTGLLQIKNPEPEKAIEYLERLANRNDFEFADQALSLLAEAYAQIGNREKAQLYFEVLKTRYPDSEFIENTNIKSSR